MRASIRSASRRIYFMWGAINQHTMFGSKRNKQPSTHPKVVCEDLTYPKVACLGGMMAVVVLSSR